MAIPEDREEIEERKLEVLKELEEHVAKGARPKGFVGPIPTQLTIHELENSLVKSASKVTEIQFLALNVCFPERKPAKDFPHLVDYYQGITEDVEFFLKNFKQLANYLRRLNGSLKKSPCQWKPFSSPEEDMGMFRPVFNGQLDVSDECERLEKLLPEDEKIFNFPLVAFLNNIVSNIPDTGLQWIHARKCLDDAQFAKATMTAEVDGFLQHNDSETEAYAIVECKCAIHQRKSPAKILWQEACEMVNWIMHDEKPGRERKHPLPGNRRMLISQDRHEIFVTLANYGRDYVDYLQNPGSNQAYMEMQEYGPYPTDSASNMRELAKIISYHAFAFRYDYQKNSPVNWKKCWGLDGPDRSSDRMEID